MKNIEKEIVSRLTGLAKAVNGDEELRSFSVDNLVIEGLQVIDSNLPIEILADISHRITLQKRKLAPNCATCLHPCSRTTDYSFEMFEKENEEIQQLKMQVLSHINQLALDNEQIDRIYQGLLLFGYEDCKKEYLTEFLDWK